MNIEVIAASAEFIVVNKPVNVSTHPSPGDSHADVVNLLKERYPEILPIMRLDAATSGLLVLARSKTAADAIDFTNKQYLAIVLGQSPASGFIDKALTKKKFGSGTKITQSALTKYRTLDYKNNLSLLQIEIETGRNHQIRKHLRTIGHPIVGDFRHGYKEKNLEIQQKLGKPLRLCLHCCQLAFKLNKKSYKYTIPLPEDMAGILLS